MQPVADVINHIIKLAQSRGEARFTLNDGQETTLRPPYLNQANIAISGNSAAGEYTLIFAAAIATVMIPGKPPEGFDRQIGYPKSGVA
jgi:hypothetical protein